MSERRKDDVIRVDLALAVTPHPVDADVSRSPIEPGKVESGTLETRRVRAISAFLLDHPSLLLPLASHFRERQLVFESAIRGPSMEPAIPSRARLRVQSLGAQPCRPGDVVFYLTDDGYMV